MTEPIGMPLDSSFDPGGSNIILIHYPPGGFGNFIFHVLSEFAAETAKISGNKEFGFGADGNSHRTKKYANSYFHDPDIYEPTINSGVDIENSTILILSDNGFEPGRESLVKQKSIFPNAQFVKVVLDSLSMPVCFKTANVKAMLNPEFGNGQEIIDHHQLHYGKNIVDYEIREHYSILYHHWTLKWNIIDPLATNFMLTNLIVDPYHCFVDLIAKLNLTLINADQLKTLCKQWANAHVEFFKVYHWWQNINAALDQQQDLPIGQMDLHDQGYINYCIEKKYNITIPVYDYRAWFSSTADILEMVKKLT